MDNTIQTNINGNNANGSWSYQVPTDLNPGEYTITLNGTASDGSSINETYTFIVSTSALPDTFMPFNWIFFIGITFVLLAFIFSKLFGNFYSVEDRLVNSV